MIAAILQHQSGWIYLGVFGVIGAIVLLLWLVNLVLVHFFPSSQTYHTTVGNALMRLDAQFLPGAREHIVEARERDDVEEDEEGEPPETGVAGR